VTEALQQAGSEKNSPQQAWFVAKQTVQVRRKITGCRGTAGTQSGILCSSQSWDRCVTLRRRIFTRTITPYITARSQPGPPQQTQVDPSIACWVSLIERLCLSLGAQRSSGPEAGGTAPPLG
jgi:hypothetical protein